ncbi:MAG: tripartite tricarboxylate transporter TctB family protein [bacterium]
MAFNGRTLFSGVILLVALWALYATRDWAFNTALYPRVVGVPLILLAAVEFVLSLRGRDGGEGGRAMDVQISTATEPAVAMRRTITTIGWLLGFFGGIWLLGFPVAIPIFVFAYLKFQGRESWLISIALAAAAWAGFDGLFVRLLHLPFGQGELLGLLR